MEICNLSVRPLRGLDSVLRPQQGKLEGKIIIRAFIDFRFQFLRVVRFFLYRQMMLSYQIAAALCIKQASLARSGVETPYL